MDVAELASYLGIPLSTVYDWRVHGKGTEMARPRLTIGTFGDITTRVMPSGRFEA
jgi:hypothetical protein